MKKITKTFPRILLLMFLPLRSLIADHGPATSGATSAVLSPVAIETHHFQLSLSQGISQYQPYADTVISDATQKMKLPGSHIDTLAMSSLTNLSLGYGIFSWLDVTATIGWYFGKSLREGILDSNTAYKLIDAGDVGGLSDFWLNSRLQVWALASWLAALHAGLKLPVGNIDGADSPVPLNLLPSAKAEGSFQGLKPLLPTFHVVSDGPGSDRFVLDPSATPGSGSFDFSLGFSMQNTFTEDLTFTAGANYFYRGYYKTYKIGDRIDAGLAVSYRIAAEEKFRLILFSELTSRYLMRAIDHDETVSNSGGFYSFWSAGAVIKFSNQLSVIFSKEFAIVQIVKEPQQKMEGRFNLGLSWNFSVYDHH